MLEKKTFLSHASNLRRQTIENAYVPILFMIVAMFFSGGLFDGTCGKAGDLFSPRWSKLKQLLLWWNQTFKTAIFLSISMRRRTLI